MSGLTASLIRRRCKSKVSATSVVCVPGADSVLSSRGVASFLAGGLLHGKEGGEVLGEGVDKLNVDKAVVDARSSASTGFQFSRWRNSDSVWDSKEEARDWEK